MGKIILVFLSLGGIYVTFYIIWHRMKKKPVVCFIGQNCEVVLESKYNALLFGIKNETLGLFFYLFLLVTVVTQMLIPSYTSAIVTVRTISVIAAFITSLVLTYIQVRVIRSYCSWCLLSAIINALLFSIVVVEQFL